MNLVYELGRPSLSEQNLRDLLGPVEVEDAVLGKISHGCSKDRLTKVEISDCPRKFVLDEVASLWA